MAFFFTKHTSIAAGRAFLRPPSQRKKKYPPVFPSSPQTSRGDIKSSGKQGFPPSQQAHITYQHVPLVSQQISFCILTVSLTPKPPPPSTPFFRAGFQGITARARTPGPGPSYVRGTASCGPANPSADTGNHSSAPPGSGRRC